jgi:hypothetical protein
MTNPRALAATTLAVGLCFTALTATPAQADEIAKDTTALLILNTADAYTTRAVQKSVPADTARVHWMRPGEINPLARPFVHSDASMYAYAGLSALAGDGLLRVLPQRWRRPTFAAMVGVEVLVIARNVHEYRVQIARRTF